MIPCKLPDMGEWAHAQRVKNPVGVEKVTHQKMIEKTLR
jgi:hypothetical protein